MKNAIGEIYKRRIEKYSTNLDKVNRKINLITFFRLIIFMLGISLSIYLYSIELFFAVSSFLVFSFLFMYAIKVHTKLFHTKLQLSNLVQINNEEIIRLEGNYSDFDTGIEFLEIDHPYTSDLDIFGNGSLFQYLNRTCGALGKKCLSSWLCQLEKEKEIILRQQAVIELKDKIDWRQKFQAIGRWTSETEQDIDSLMNWLSETSYFINHKLYKFLLIFLPLSTLSLFILSVFLIPVSIPILFVLLQYGIIRLNVKKINDHHAQISKKYDMLSTYVRQIDAIENEKFVCEKLMTLKNNLIKSVSGKTAGKNIRTLAKMVNAFDRRLDTLLGLILNGLLMWDLQCVLRLEKWRINFKDEIENWFKTISEIDALASLGCFYFNNPEFIIPEINNKEFALKANDLGHPLIDKKDRICNDLEIDDIRKFILITGSNMAGKSTFLRTVGISLVLAMMGAPTCAKYLSIYPIQIYTNMRIRDSLSSGESTFYAELKRLKTILDVLNNEQKALILFDEILQGTNSKDKHIGSKALIEQLIEKKGVGLIATHDLALGSMAKQYPENIRNYCFEVKIKDEEFIYDYKLKEGICKTMNATDLMKKMGITIEES